jgi:long-subunit acyl-CoA synthetase (AMP-forming)
MDMKNLLDSWPDNPVLLSNGRDALDRAALVLRIDSVMASLRARATPAAAVAILADNDPEWLVVDLATQALDVALVPLPSFFTPEQMLHAIHASGAQAMFCADADLAALLGFLTPVAGSGPLGLYERVQAATTVPLNGIQKITFTSGTTAAPKGVCLRTGQQWELACALQDGLAPLRLERHLCLLPFAVLLENIAGAYTALLSGATTICPPLIETGLSGASGFDPQVCMDTIERYAPHSIILVPQMLQALVAAAAPEDPRLRSLRFVAVGGGKTSPALLAAARGRGLPVYEGYGLSECASVVALNLPGAERAGSVGRPLPNRTVRIAPDGEILVAGTVAHYLGESGSGSGEVATGDLGRVDGDGFLFVDGRKKDVLITGFGRNISPEWPESILTGTGVIAQALVIGEAQPYLVALVVPARAGLAHAALEAVIARANAELPDYARIQRWLVVPPFTPANGLATANGRPRRERIQTQHAARIATLFDSQETMQ